jgi:hypothetical protein
MRGTKMNKRNEVEPPGRGAEWRGLNLGPCKGKWITNNSSASASGAEKGDGQVTGQKQCDWVQAGCRAGKWKRLEKG